MLQLRSEWLWHVTLLKLMWDTAGQSDTAQICSAYLSLAWSNCIPVHFYPGCTEPGCSLPTRKAELSFPQVASPCDAESHLHPALLIRASLPPAPPVLGCCHARCVLFSEPEKPAAVIAGLKSIFLELCIFLTTSMLRFACDLFSSFLT